MASDGVRKIIEEIEKSVKSQVSETLEQARTKAADIMEEARQKAEEQARGILTRGEQEARREAQRIMAEARIKAKREAVSAQEELVQESFDLARKALAELARQRSAGGVDYNQVLKRLIYESVTASGESSLEVLVDARDRDIVSESLLQSIAGEAGSQLGGAVSIRLAEERLVCAGGAVARSADSRVRIDNTFEARIERYKEAVRTRVAQALFSGEPSNG